MKKDARDYLAAADVLRIISIGLIGWYHIWQQSWLDPGFRMFGNYVNLQNVVRHGYMLVDVVLVISGFLLSLPYARVNLGLGEHPSVKQFYVKRFWRIIPSYLMAVLLCLFLWALPRHEYTSVSFMVKDLLTHLTFTHNLNYYTYFMTPLQIVLWTMGVEVQFYILFPLVARFYEKTPGLTCLVLTLIAALFRLRVYVMPDTTMWVNQLPCMLDLYAAGLAAGWIYTSAARRKISAGARWLMAGLALLCLLIILQLMYMGVIDDYDAVRREQLALRLPLGMAAGAFLVCGCLAPPALNRALGNPVVRFLSAVSYNFYMWHQTLAVWLKELHLPAYTAELPNQAGEQPWQTRYTWLCFAAALGAAALLTYLWERPVNRWGLKRMGGMPKPSA